MSYSDLVIFDTDSGTDDAWALFMLLKAEAKHNIKILGVSIVQGNTSLENAAENALRCLSAVNRLDVNQTNQFQSATNIFQILIFSNQIPVYKGAAEPMVKDFKRNWYHGKNGFGDVVFPTTPDLSLIAEENAINYMYRMAKEVRVYFI